MPFDPDWAIGNDLADYIEKHFLHYKPRVVVEFGSGKSTALMGSLVGSGGTVTAYEQSPVFAEQTFAEIYEMPWVTLVQASIKDGWYSGVDVPDQIDFVLVDGPGPCKDRTRGPAMDAVYGNLSPDAFVVVDDANRQSAKDEVDEWLTTYPDLRSLFVPLERGMIIVWKTDAEHR